MKPENLLCSRVDGHDVVKLADFGSAVQLPECGVAAVDPVAQGTTLYSPPEVLHGQAYTTGADLWAAGITTCVQPPHCTPLHAAARAARRGTPRHESAISPRSLRPT